MTQSQDQADCEAPDVDDSESQESQGDRGPEDKPILTKVTLTLNFPMTLTREVMEKLLPEHDCKHSAHALMYV